MFVNTCTACGQDQLIFLSQVSSYEATSRGTVAHYTCWCGAAQAWTLKPEAQTRLVAA